MGFDSVRAGLRYICQTVLCIEGRNNNNKSGRRRRRGKKTKIKKMQRTKEKKSKECRAPRCGDG